MSKSTNDVWTQVKNTLREKFIPFEMVLELTRRCNLRCCHCYNLKDNAELSLSQVKEIIPQLRRAGCLFVILTGGEVFLKPDFLDIAASLREANFDIKIFTNGTLIDAGIARELKKIAPSEVGISVLGAQSATHDMITGVAGSFAKSLAAIAALRKEQIPVTLKCALMRQNFSEYKDIIALAKKLGTPFIVDPILSPRDDGSKDVLGFRLTKTQLEEFYQEQIPHLSAMARGDEDLTCSAGYMFGSISARGDVYPCIQLPIKVGNVFKQDFKNIWQDALLLKKMRQVTPEQISLCSECKIISSCTRCPGLAFLEDGDMFGASSVACLHTQLLEKLKAN